MSTFAPYLYRTYTTIGLVGSGADYQVDGIDDNVQFNQAMTAVSAAGGGIIFVLAGTFMISNNLQIPSNIELTGSGVGVSIIKAINEYTPTDTGYFGTYSSSMVIAKTNPVSNINISGFTFDMNGSNKTGLTSNGQHMAIQVWHATNVRFTDNKVIDAVNWGIFFRDTDYLWIQRNQVLSGVGSTYNQQDGIHVRSCQKFWITHNHVNTAGGGTAGDDAIACGVDASKDTRDCKDGVISHNILSSFVTGIKLLQEGDYNVDNIIVSDNQIDYAYRVGIQVVKLDSTEFGKFHNITIDSNNIHDFGVYTGAGVNDGIICYQSTSPKYTIFNNLFIANNVIVKMTNTTSGSGGIRVVAKGIGLTISGNHLAELTSTRGMEIGGASTPIVDVKITDNFIDTSTCANDHIGLFMYGVSRSNVSTNIFKGGIGGTSQAIRIAAAATAGNDLEGSPNAEPSQYINVQNNTFYNFDIGIREANSGADPNNNYFINNHFNGVAEQMTVIGANTKFMQPDGIGSANTITANTTFGNFNITTFGAQAIDKGGSISYSGYSDDAASTLRVFATTEGRKETGTTGVSTGYFIIKTNAAGTLSERVRVTSAGNVKIGGTASRGTTEGTNEVVIFDGTAPVGTLANGISLYSTSGELRVMDAAGNATLLSPHNKITNEWIYHSKNTVTGQVLHIDMERLMKEADRRFGGSFIKEYIETA